MKKQLNIEELLKGLKGDQLLLAALRLSLKVYGEDGESVLRAAAVPHWFDEGTLKQMLGFEAKRCAELTRAVRALATVVTDEQGRSTVHDQTRAALRLDLWQNDRDGLREVSHRATIAYAGPSVRERIEKVYHLALVEEDQFWKELRILNDDLYHHPEGGQLMSKVMDEFRTTDVGSESIRGCAFVIEAANGVHHARAEARHAMALEGQRLFSAAGKAWEEAYATLLLGDTSLELGQLYEAERYYARGLAMMEKLALAQREPMVKSDLVSAYDRMANLWVKRQDVGDLDGAIGLLRSAKAVREQLIESKGIGVLHDQRINSTRLGEILLLRGQKGDAEEAYSELNEDLRHSRRLLERNPGSALAERDVSLSLGRVADLLMERAQLGDQEKALRLYEEALDIQRRLLERNPGSALAERDVSLALGSIADFLKERAQLGDQEKALHLYEENLAITRRLLERNPGSALAERDVSVSLLRIADLLKERAQHGDQERALQLHEEGLVIRRRLLERNPGSAQAERDVSLALERIADLLKGRAQKGDQERSLELQQECLAIRRRLLERNPGSALAERDVSLALERIADLLRGRAQQGDQEQALQLYEEDLAITRRLLERNPGSAQAERDVSVSLGHIANLLIERAQHGDQERALKLSAEDLATSRRLLARNPGSAQAERDVSVSLERVADLLKERAQDGDQEEALGHYEEALAIARRLLERNQDSAFYMRTLVVDLYKCSLAHAELGATKEARAYSEECKGILERMEAEHMTMDNSIKYLLLHLKQTLG